MGTDQDARGSLLIISLWLVTILSVLAVAIGRYLSTEVRLARYQLAQARAAALARGGVYGALQVLKADLQEKEEGGLNYDWLGDDWAQFTGSGVDGATWVMEWPVDAANPLRGTQRLEVTMTDEERKLNFNDVVRRLDNFNPVQVDAQASFQALRAVFGGSRPAAVAALDWFDAGATPLDPAQAMAEPDPTTGVRAKNGPALSLAEVLAVPGVREALPAIEQQLPEIQQRLSVVEPGSGESRMNLNTVEPEILQGLGMEALYGALPQCRTTGFTFSETTRSLYEQFKDCNSAVEVESAEQDLLAEFFGITSETFRVISTGAIAESDANGTARPPVRACVEAVVRRQGCEPDSARSCIIAWGNCLETS